MITQDQEKYILSLFEELGQDPEENISNLTRIEAHKLIQELLEVRNEVIGKWIY